MAVSFQGFNEQIATFIADPSVKQGDWVKISANGTVAPCTAGDAPCGKVVSVRGGAAAVQVRGYVSTATSDTLSLGWQEVTAATATSVKAATATPEKATEQTISVLVVESASGAAGILL